MKIENTTTMTLEKNSGLPVFVCNKIEPNGPEHLIVSFQCPCGSRHHHGWGKDQLRNVPQHRIAHCTNGPLKESNYYIALEMPDQCVSDDKPLEQLRREYQEINAAELKRCRTEGVAERMRIVEKAKPRWSFDKHKEIAGELLKMQACLNELGADIDRTYGTKDTLLKRMRNVGKAINEIRRALEMRLIREANALEAVVDLDMYFPGEQNAAKAA